MNLFELSASIVLDTASYEKGLKDAQRSTEQFGGGVKNSFAVAQQSTKSFGDKLKKGLTTVAKGAVATLGTAAAAVAKLTKEAVKNAAEYEQLAGGVEKIFSKMDTSKIFKDASNAYKDLGMSMNQYLSAINDVGAAFKSTMGDAKGYETARKGLQAISDYASGTGKSVDELTGKFMAITRSTASYQSIADQFSGILPATSADFLEQAQAAGLLSTSYKKLTEVPIAEYQATVTAMLEKGTAALGLTGNTAAEAATTISGSVAAVQASWQNLMTGLSGGAGELDALVDSFTDSVLTAADNILPVAERVLAGMGRAVERGVPKLTEKLPDMLRDAVPKLTESAESLVDAVVDALPEIGEAALDIAPDIVDNLGSALTHLVVKIPDMAFEVGPAAIDSLAEILQSEFAKNAVGGGLISNMLFGDTSKAAEAGEKMGDSFFVGLKKFAAKSDFISGLIGWSDADRESILRTGQTVAENMIAGARQKLTEQSGEVATIFAGSIDARRAEMESAGTGIIDGVTAGIDGRLPVLNTHGTMLSAEVINGMMTGSLEASSAGTGLLDNFYAGLTPGPQLPELGAAASQSVVAGFRSADAWMAEAGLSLTNSAASGVSSGAPQLGTQGAELANAAVSGFESSGGGAQGAGASLGQSLESGLLSASGGVAGAGTQLGASAVSGTESNTGAMTGAGAALGLSVQSGLTSSQGSVSTAANALGTVAAGGVNANRANLQTAGVALGEGVRSGLSSKQESVRTAASGIGTSAAVSVSAKGPEAYSAGSGLGSKVVSGLSEGSKGASSIGTNIVSGIRNGISSGWSALTGYVREKAQSLLSAAKAALGIASPSKKFRDEVGSMIAAGIKLGFLDESGAISAAVSSVMLDVTKDAAASAADVEAVVAKAVGAVSKTYEKTSGSGKNKKTVTLTKDAEKYAKELLSSAESTLKDYKTVHDVSLADEAAYWQKLLASMSKGTASYDKANTKYLAAVKARDEKLTEYNDKALALEETYYENSAKINQKLASDIEKVNADLEKSVGDLWSKYNDTVTKRAGSLYGSLGGLFNGFKSETENTTETLLANMNSQLAGLRTWQRDIELLSTRGIADGLMEELRSLGPKAAADIAVLTQMTNQELEGYVAMWEQTQAICTEIATDEAAELRGQTVWEVSKLEKEAKAEIDKLNSDAEASLTELRNEFVAQLSALSQEATAAVGTMPEAFKSAGLMTANGMAAGIRAGRSSVVSAAAEMAAAAVAAVKSELGIASPSKVFRDKIGKMMAAGIGVGFTAQMPKEISSIRRALDFPLTVPTASFSADGGSGANAGKTAAPVTIIQNIYSQAKTAADLARETRWEAEKAVLTGV